MKVKVKYMGAALVACLAFSSCSDDFLKEKISYDQTTLECYNSYAGAKGRVSDIYKWCQPDVNTDANWKYPTTGRGDDISKCTEEFTGLGGFVDELKEYTSHAPNVVPDFGFSQSNNIQTMAYGRIRNVNDVIQGIENGDLPEDQKRELLGQVHFWRAWCYYLLVKWYGGVPIVTVPQPAEAASFVQRSSTKECIEFMCDDLDKAADYLAPYTTNGGWPSSEDYGRVTSGAALALKGRILLMYASPLFNRSNDQQRWQDAYDCIKASIPVLNSCGHDLAYEGNPGSNASNWAKMFSDGGKANKEAVLVTLYNDILKGGTPDYHFNNSWEDLIRPGNALGSGLNASATMVDLFPMKDGKLPVSCTAYDNKLDHSTLPYDEETPFLDRDPRFYRTFAFPGVRWAFNGDPNTSTLNNPYEGKDYVLWNYVWFEKEEARDDVYGEKGSAYGSDNLSSGVKGIYVRKRSDDADVNSAQRYIYSSETGFEQSANSWMEIRYTEVLLNLAEAACQIGELNEAVDILQRIRGRVGYTSDNNYGLQANLRSDQAACMAAILYERQIEFAYEGKRFDDVHRWLLWDGGADFSQVQGAPSTWLLSGWGGNTCTYLGFKPLNGQRRENLLFRVKNDIANGLGGVNWQKNPDTTPIEDPNNPDPLLKHLKANNVNRADYVVDLRKTGTEFETQLQKLATFYKSYLVRKLRKGDGWDNATYQEYSIKYRPHYYFLGLGSNAQNNNKTDNDHVLQTIGWEDNLTDNWGTFDPLAE